jgi:hypothetical protein
MFLERRISLRSAVPAAMLPRARRAGMEILEFCEELAWRVKSRILLSTSFLICFASFL